MGWGGITPYRVPLTGKANERTEVLLLVGIRCRRNIKLQKGKVQRAKQNDLEPKGGKKYPRQNIARANQGPISAPHRPQLNALSDTNNR